MAKGAHLTEQVENLIAKIHRDHPDWGATKIRKSLLGKLEYLGISKNFGPEWPGVGAVQRVLTDIRESTSKRSPESQGLDDPWNIGTLAKYPITPEALPLVMSFYKRRLTANDILTIREALWTARLYKISDDPVLVCNWAFLYAFEEMISEDLGKSFDSTNLDLNMIKNPYYARETQREIDIWAIADKYGADALKLKELNLSIEETEEIAKTGKYQKEAQHERLYTPKG